MNVIKLKLFASIFVLSLVCIGAFYYVNSSQTNAIKALNDVNIDKLEMIKEYPSPNGKQKLTIYLTGGVFLKSDYSYIGYLTSNETKKKGKFILWLPPEPFKIKWINTNELKVNEKQINVNKENYDFR